MRVTALISALWVGTGVFHAFGEAAVSYHRDVRPILSEKCFICHGPDERTRKAGLRLDQDIAQVSGAPALGELINRITTEVQDDLMPPPEAGKPLTPVEIDLLKKWIDEGAKFEKHWALLAPGHPEPPSVAHPEMVRNPIDNFVLARLEKEGLPLSPEADKAVLARRLSLDLTGLPPDRETLKNHLSDTGNDAYERLVEHLLASPAYGEHMARRWLDLARYGDTNGYQIDNERYMWPWRDWVISAFNSNMPFDEFTVNQIAGDLRPNATLEANVATGFLRNHMTTSEGGVIAEEYRTQYVIDRLNTTSTVWLGLTMGCAQCHDHKYDPITTKDFYGAFAFFNSVPESGADGRYGNSQPVIAVPTPEQAAQAAELEQQIASLDTQLHQPLPELDANQAAWEQVNRERTGTHWNTVEAESISSRDGTRFRVLEDKSVLAEGPTPDKDVYTITGALPGGSLRALRVEALTDSSMVGFGPGRAHDGNFMLCNLEAEVSSGGGESKRVRFVRAVADYSEPRNEVGLAIDAAPDSGWSVEAARRHENRVAVFVTNEAYGFGAGTTLTVRLFFDGQAFNKHSMGRFRLSTQSEEPEAASRIGNWNTCGPMPALDAKAAYETPYSPESKVDLKELGANGKPLWNKPEAVFQNATLDMPPGPCAAYLHRVINAPSIRKMTLAVGNNDGVKVWVNGKIVFAKYLENAVRQPNAPEDFITVDLVQGRNEVLVKAVNHGPAYSLYVRCADEDADGIPLGLEALVGQKQESIGQKQVRAYYRREHWALWPELDARLDETREKLRRLEVDIPQTMVMRDLPQPRDTFVLTRGQYDQPGEKVAAAIPAALGTLPPGAPANRLGFAQWLTSKDNPLTARVFVNRIWENYFGHGIVKSVEDFGIQGDLPTHPDLLDWLAQEFMASGWDVKALQRLIVGSATYRQSSRSTPDLNQRDPENLLLARGPRFRLDAEVIRDAALASSGLLSHKIGGPSVRPYQPDLWKEVSYDTTGRVQTAQVFIQDTGESLYRRSLYTFWKRQSPPPTMLALDAPTREVCLARRSRTNTPLQALALMNDPQFIEAARALAQRVLTNSDTSMEARITAVYQQTIARLPSDEERSVLTAYLDEQLRAYRAAPNEAEKLLAIGESRPEAKIDPVELAAWSMLANLLLNLDENLSKS